MQRNHLFSKPLPSLVAVPQGGFTLIDLTCETKVSQGTQKLGAYTTFMTTCEPLIILNHTNDRFILCHLDHPDRLKILPDLLTWVTKENTIKAKILMDGNSAYQASDIQRYAKKYFAESEKAPELNLVEINRLDERHVDIYVYLHPQKNEICIDDERPASHQCIYDNPRLNSGRVHAHEVYDLLPSRISTNSDGYINYLSPAYSPFDKMWDSSNLLMVNHPVTPLQKKS